MLDWSAGWGADAAVAVWLNVKTTISSSRKTDGEINTGRCLFISSSFAGITAMLNLPVGVQAIQRSTGYSVFSIGGTYAMDAGLYWRVISPVFASGSVLHFSITIVLGVILCQENNVSPETSETITNNFESL
jgi:hypothetical protein